MKKDGRRRKLRKVNAAGALHKMLVNDNKQTKIDVCVVRLKQYGDENQGINYEHALLGFSHSRKIIVAVKAAGREF
jgi:hypothetical protein